MARFLFLLSALLPIAASAELPRASSQEECLIFGDMMIVAGAAARENLPLEVAGGLFFAIYSLDDPRHEVVSRAVLKHAYAAKPADPREYGAIFARGCIAHGGKLDGLLGAAL